MGGRWRPDALSLADRVALTRANEAGRRGDRRGLPCHVWVDGDRPGLLLEWQQRDGWWGRVVLVEPEGPEVAWVRADRLKPAQ